MNLHSLDTNYSVTPTDFEYDKAENSLKICARDADSRSLADFIKVNQYDQFKIEKINVQVCNEIENLDFLAPFLGLKEVSVDIAPNLIDVSGLSACTHLEKLKLRRCSKLPNLTTLKTVNSVSALEIKACPKLTSLEGIEDLGIRSVVIDECLQLKDLKAIACLKKVEKIVLASMPSLGKHAQFSEFVAALLSSDTEAKHLKSVSAENCGMKPDDRKRLEQTRWVNKGHVVP